MSDLTVVEFILARINDEATAAGDVAVFVADQSPELALRRCTALRAIVEPWGRPEAAAILRLWANNLDLTMPRYIHNARVMLFELAGIWADHPDYRAAWSA